MKKTTRQTMKKTLAALLAAAGMTSTCVPVYAEDTLALTEAAYTVTEDEQGTITIAFNEPIVLSSEESYAGSEAEEDGGAVPYGDVCYTYIPQEYWGYYTSTGGNFTLSIKSENRIMFDGRYNFDGPNNFWHVFCYYDYVKEVYFYPKRNMSDGLVITYDRYTIIKDSGNELCKKDIKISGWYEEKDHTFVLYGIIYHPEK